eukprot:2593254-Rhodomonas_salina.1
MAAISWCCMAFCMPSSRAGCAICHQKGGFLFSSNWTVCPIEGLCECWSLKQQKGGAWTAQSRSGKTIHAPTRPECQIQTAVART